MNLNRYPFFASNDFQDYSFYSEGPKGKIKKSVTYSKISTNPIVYNLSFGDENPYTSEISDTVITNNQDRDTVLSTVALTVVTFFEHHRADFIYATGSTPSRTRLYQIGIAGLWEEIKKDFEVYGFRDDQWLEFKRMLIMKRFWFGVNNYLYLISKKSGKWRLNKS